MDWRILVNDGDDGRNKHTSRGGSSTIRSQSQSKVLGVPSPGAVRSSSSGSHVSFLIYLNLF